jgi:molybdenum cofactor cytidylyltransferase
VLMLGDQPGVSASAVRALIDGRGDADLAACAYADGRGHPFAFARRRFAELATLHGDKGVWKLMDREGPRVRDVPVSGPVPLDIDTWEDYQAVLAAAPVGAKG